MTAGTIYHLAVKHGFPDGPIPPQNAGLFDDIINEELPEPAADEFGFQGVVAVQPSPEAQAAVAAANSKTKAKGKPERSYAVEFPDMNRRDEPVANSVANVRVCLDHLGISTWYDEFRVNPVFEGISQRPMEMDDHALIEAWSRIQTLGYYPTKGHVQDAVDAISRADKRHPIRDWLDGLKWDGKARLCDLFAGYAETAKTPYQRACGVLLLVAMVRRVRQPGAKFDHVVILKGPQCIGKSGFFQLLAGDAYFTDSFSFALDDKQMIEQTGGMWLAEAAEMRGLKTKDIEHVKAMVTRTADRARKAWGRTTTSAPRQFVAVATTNNEGLYSDHTGGRRWDIVAVTGFNWDAIKRDRNQLFAEAAVLEKTYGPLVLPESVIAEAKIVQEQHRIEDPAHTALETLLDGRTGFVALDELYAALGLTGGQTHLRHNPRYAAVIKEVTGKLGWGKARSSVAPRPWGFSKRGEIIDLSAARDAA